MKITLLILHFFLVFHFFSQENCHLEILKHHNGKPSEIYEFDTINNSLCGNFQKFDTTGILLEEGCYEARRDSVLCKDCYEGASAFLHEYSKLEKYEYLNNFMPGALKTGTWKYYHPNGNLKAIGIYAPQFHVYNGTSLSLKEEKNDGHAINVYIHFDQLKTGIWNYYDENGNNMLTEEYINGALVYKVERN